jgi:hypothetical protein
MLDTTQMCVNVLTTLLMEHDHLSRHPSPGSHTDMPAGGGLAPGLYGPHREETAAMRAGALPLKPSLRNHS